jgi:hypothetical protein
MSSQDMLRGLNRRYVEGSELPPQMRNLPCAVGNASRVPAESTDGS